MTQPKIITSYDPKPIPVCNYDWSATVDGYEPGDPIGWGETEDVAVRDLLGQLEDAALAADDRAAGAEGGRDARR